MVDEPRAEAESAPDGALFLQALRAAVARTPVWLVVWFLQALIALAPAVVFYLWFDQATQHRYAPGSLFANLDGTFRWDHREALGALDTANARAGAVLAIVAMLVSAFCAGGWLQVFLDESTRGHTLRRFFFGGGRYLLRFTRVLLLTLVVLGLLRLAVFGELWEKLVLDLWQGLPEGPDRENLHAFENEWTAIRIRWLQQGIWATCFGLVLTWADYTRTRLALHDTSSALWAGICTFFTILMHPIRTLRPMIALFLAEVVVVFGAGLIASSIEDEMFEHAELLGVGFLFLIGQVTLIWRTIVRGARYQAAVNVSRGVVRPISRPDPWKQSIGGPGGPRYPIGGEDQYETSV